MPSFSRFRSSRHLAGLLALGALAFPSFGLDFKEAQAWLEKEAARMAHSSRMKAQNGILIFTPDASAHYQALWTRDFFYLLEGAPEAASDEEAEACFRYLIGGQREDGAMPDRVQADGLAVYLPGPVGAGIGKLPATDNPAFMVKLAALLCDRKNDWSLYREFRAALAKGLEYPEKSPDGLLWIDPREPHSPYGFTDTVFKTGELFFSSMLQWEAYRDMAAMDRRIGEELTGKEYEERAANLREKLQKFWDTEAGMFRAATLDCNQIDVWGSAYAVYSGLASGDQGSRIADYLIRNRSGLLQHGQLRHCAPGEYWQRGLTPKDKYQNGGYWATPFGWWYYTVSEKDPDLANRAFLELVADFQERGVNEWVLGDQLAVPDYVASACQPLAGLRRVAERR